MGARARQRYVARLRGRIGQPRTSLHPLPPTRPFGCSHDFGSAALASIALRAEREPHRRRAAAAAGDPRLGTAGQRLEGALRAPARGARHPRADRDARRGGLRGGVGAVGGGRRPRGPDPEHRPARERRRAARHRDADADPTRVPGDVSGLRPVGVRPRLRRDRRGPAQPSRTGFDGRADRADAERRLQRSTHRCQAGQAFGSRQPGLHRQQCHPAPVYRSAFAGGAAFHGAAAEPAGRHPKFDSAHQQREQLGSVRDASG